MKNTRCCPKCEGKELWKVDPLRTVYENSPGTIPLHLNYAQPTGATGFLADKEERVGTFVAYVCAACGFTELWAEGLERLARDSAHGVTKIGS